MEKLPHQRCYEMGEATIPTLVEMGEAKTPALVEHTHRACMVLHVTAQRIMLHVTAYLSLG